MIRKQSDLHSTLKSFVPSFHYLAKPSCVRHYHFLIIACEIHDGKVQLEKTNKLTETTVIVQIVTKLNMNE